MPVSVGPNGIEDRLLFAVDAANVKSYYPRSFSNYFDGSGDLLTVNPTASLDLTGDFTIELWLKTTGTSGFVINKGGGLNIAWASYEIVISGTDILWAASSANAGYDIGGENATGKIGSFTAGQWTHVAVTRSGNVYRGFVNGVQGYTQTLALTPYTASTRGLNIGASYQNAWGVVGNISGVLTGHVSNLRIIKGTALYTANFTVPVAPLTAVANTSLLTCQNNTFIDNSINNFTITSYGNVTTSTLNPFDQITWGDLVGNNNGTLTNDPIFFLGNGGGMTFDGVNDFCNFGNILDFTTTSFSVEAWFRKIGDASSNTFGGAIAAKGSYGPDDGWSMFVNDTNYDSGNAGFQVRDAGTPISAGTSFTVQSNIWYHMVGVRDTTNKQIYLFVNGVLHSSTAENPTTNATSAQVFYIGNVAGQSRHFNGNISMVKIYNKALNSSEILQLFNATRSRFGV